MSKRAATLYLQDILTSIKKIEEYSQDLSFKEFSKDEKTIDSVVRNLEIVGEAARNIPKEISQKNPDVPWEKMVSMRNKVLHEYFGVDEDILWKTITEDLPKLKKQLQSLAKALA